MSGDESALHDAITDMVVRGRSAYADRVADAILALPELQALRRDAEIGRSACEAIVDTSKRITDSYPEGLCREAVDRRRLDKVAIEAGEMLEAYSGTVGENPRKGVTHTEADVLDELLDVALTALGAYEHLTDWQGTSMAALAEQAVRKHDRLVAALAAGDAKPLPGVVESPEVLTDDQLSDLRAGWDAKPPDGAE